MKGCYYKSHKGKTHDTTNYSVLKREIDEKQLKGNLIQIEWSLRAKFDADKSKDGAKANDHPQETLTIWAKSGRLGDDIRMDNIIRSMQNFTFSMTDLCPTGWRGDNPLIIQGSIGDIIIHRVYVDTHSSADIIHEHYLYLIPEDGRRALSP